MIRVITKDDDGTVVYDDMVPEVELITYDNARFKFQAVDSEESK